MSESARKNIRCQYQQKYLWTDKYTDKDENVFIRGCKAVTINFKNEARNISIANCHNFKISINSDAKIDYLEISECEDITLAIDPSAEINDLRIDKIKFCSRIFQNYENRHYFTTIKNIFAKQNKAREERDFYYLEQQFDVEKGKKDLQELWQNIKNSNIKNIFAKKNKAKEDNSKKKRYKPFKLKVEFLELFSLLIFELISKKGTSLTRILYCFGILGLSFAIYQSGHNLWQEGAKLDCDMIKLLIKSSCRFAFSQSWHFSSDLADGLKFILSPFSFPEHSQLKLSEALFYALRTMLWLIFSFMLHKRFRINS